MNKYQEAYDYILIATNGGEGIVREMNIIHELVEKATPKKPTVHCSGYFSGIPIYDEYSCPSCSARVDNTYHHCKCGQALDWNKEDVD